MIADAYRIFSIEGETKCYIGGGRKLARHIRWIEHQYCECLGCKMLTLLDLVLGFVPKCFKECTLHDLGSVAVRCDVELSLDS